MTFLLTSKVIENKLNLLLLPPPKMTTTPKKLTYDQATTKFEKLIIDICKLKIKTEDWGKATFPKEGDNSYLLKIKPPAALSLLQIRMNFLLNDVSALDLKLNAKESHLLHALAEASSRAMHFKMLSSFPGELYRDYFVDDVFLHLSDVAETGYLFVRKTSPSSVLQRLLSDLGGSGVPKTS